MKIIKNLLLTVVLIQLSHVFAVPGSSPNHSQPSTLVSQTASRSSSPSRSPENQYESHEFSTAEQSDSDTHSTQLDDEHKSFQTWNKYLQEYVREKIPNIKPNKAIRDYLTRLEIWAPHYVQYEFKDECNERVIEIQEEYLAANTMPPPITKDQYMSIAFGSLNEVIIDVYDTLRYACELKGLRVENDTVNRHKINKFFVIKAINEHEHKLFDEQKLPRNRKNKWIAALNALKFIKDIEPLPCPYTYEIVNNTVPQN